MNMAYLHRLTAFWTTLYQRYPSFFHVGALFLLIFAAFGQSLNFDFVWDDLGLIVDNDNLKAASPWYSTFLRDFWEIGQNVKDPTRNFYRPIISFSYLIDYNNWGLDARGFHFTNILAHLLCTLIVYRLGILLFKGLGLAFLGAAIFGVHPAHVENVSWIAGRTDIFCGIFYFLAFFLFVQWTEKKRGQTVLLSALAYLFSLLSKEMGITLPMVILVYYALLDRSRHPWRRIVYPFLLYILISLSYLFVRMMVLGKVAGTAVFGSLWQRLLSLPMVFSHYLGLLVNLLPIDPHHHEGFVDDPWQSRLWIGLSVCLLYLVLLVWSFRKHGRKFFFPLAFVPLTLLPLFNLGTFGDVLFADRFLYIPSFGLSVAIMALFHLFEQRPAGTKSLRVTPVILILTFVGILVYLSRFHGAYWADNISLFSRAAKTSPDSAYIHYNLGNSLLTANPEEALHAYEKAIELEPNYFEARANLGIALNNLGRYHEAIDCFRALNNSGYRSHVVYANLGHAYRETGKLSLARFAYEQALKIKETPAAHNNLGEILMNAGSLTAARTHFQAVLAQEPSPEPYNNIGLLAMKENDFKQAIDSFNRAIAFQDQKLSVDLLLAMHFNLALAYDHENDHPRAVAHARQALIFLIDDSGQPEVKREIAAQLEKIIFSPSAAYE